MTSEAIEAAAKWWGDTLRETPRHNLLGNTAPRASAGAVIGEALINVLSGMAKPIPEEQVVAFEKALVETITAEIDGMNKAVTGGVERIMLDVDYNPNRPLAEAAARAGFDPKYRLPSKTTMFLHKDGTIEMRSGYGQPYLKYRVENGRLVRQ